MKEEESQSETQSETAKRQGAHRVPRAWCPLHRVHSRGSTNAKVHDKGKEEHGMMEHVHAMLMEHVHAISEHASTRARVQGGKERRQCKSIRARQRQGVSARERKDVN